MEGDFKGLLPQELLIVVLVDESFGGFLDLIKAKSDLIDRDKQLELVLDFNQVITVVAGCSRVLRSVDTAGHHYGERDKVSNDLVNDVADTILA